MWWDTAACESPTAFSMSQAHSPRSPAEIRSQEDFPRDLRSSRIFKRVGSPRALKTVTRSFPGFTYRNISIRTRARQPRCGMKFYLLEVVDAERGADGRAARIVVFEGSAAAGAGPVSVAGPAGAVPPLMPTDQT